MNAYQNYLIVLGYLSTIVCGDKDKTKAVEASLMELYKLAKIGETEINKRK